MGSAAAEDIPTHVSLIKAVANEISVEGYARMFFKVKYEENVIYNGAIPRNSSTHPHPQSKEILPVDSLRDRGHTGAILNQHASSRFSRDWFF